MQAPKPAAKRARGNRGNDKPQKVDPLKPKIEHERNDKNAWTTIEKKQKMRKVKPVRKRDRGVALVL